MGARATRRSGIVTALGLGLLLLGSVTLALVFGEHEVSITRAFADPSSLDRTILLTARLPRVAVAAVAGGALGAVGVAFQALLRNPLADPYVLGVSGGAALGATIAIVLGVSTLTLVGASTVPVAAFLGGLGAAMLVHAIARAAGDLSGTSIILAGVIVNAIASALITFTKAVVSASKAQELLFWLMGFIEVPSTAELASMTVWVTVGLVALAFDAGRMNLLALGREPARHVGVDVERFERRVFFSASCIVGAVVSVTGLVGFVGLVVPHVARRMVGPDHRVLLPNALLLGATTLVTCDLAARALFRFLGTTLPVGVLTAVLGGPVFLLLLHRTRRDAMTM